MTFTYVLMKTHEKSTRNDETFDTLQVTNKYNPKT